MGLQKGEVEKAAQDLDSHSSSDDDDQPHEGGQPEDGKLQNVAGSSASVPSTSTTSNDESVPAAGHLDRTPGPSKDNALRTGGISEAIRPVEPTGAGSQRGGTLNDRKREAENPGNDAPPPKIQKLEIFGGPSRIESMNIPIRPPASRQGLREVDQWVSRQGEIGGNNPANPGPEIPVPPAPPFRNREGIADRHLLWNQDGNRRMIPVLLEMPPRNGQGIEDRHLVWNQHEYQRMIPVLVEMPPRVRMAPQESVDFYGNFYDDDAEIINEFAGGNDDEAPNGDEEPYDAD